MHVAVLVISVVGLLSVRLVAAGQDSGSVIPAESRPCVDCHAFEFMQRALQDLKKTAYNLDTRTETLLLRAEKRGLCTGKQGTVTHCQVTTSCAVTLGNQSILPCTLPKFSERSQGPRLYKREAAGRSNTLFPVAFHSTVALVTDPREATELLIIDSILLDR
ncbi:hypothetical protein AV530_017186 [Patagioenas fasciata monilis]|uniref:NELL2-interacting cell ontogeny regulator 1 n=1 Tax=Patagioenas fasciata monilis TaxID=372326 RepID=A0A1V4JFL3_PATFA|nr:hypothetical protein AV530_017186 [Patagioenas fasciata monilis]